MSKNDGGPAFPHSTDDPDGVARTSWYGMSLRDYFAAHAPTEIPQWFEIEEKPLPAYPPLHEFFKDQRECDIANSWLRDDAGCDLYTWMPDPGLPGAEGRAKAFQAAVEAVTAARGEHTKRARIQRMIQWRWHYADLMLGAR